MNKNSKFSIRLFLSIGVLLAIVMCVYTIAEAKNEKNYGVAQNGALKIKNGFLRNQKGKKFQLRGMSSHGLAWFPEYVNKDSIETLYEYESNVFRSAMYTAQKGSYIDNPEYNKKLLFQSVDNTIASDMYAIIDWHTLRDNDPNIYINEAMQFFDEAALRYADSNAVIYEICNEPNSGTTWKQIKAYAEKVIPIIRKHSPEAIILVGTPNYCTDLNSPMQDPLSDPNVMYTYHFYTGINSISNTIKLLRKAKDNKFPIFVSEWGFSYDEKQKNLNAEAAKKFLSYLDDHSMSWVNWSLCNKKEDHSAILPECSKTSDWLITDLTESGQFVFRAFKR